MSDTPRTNANVRELCQRSKEASDLPNDLNFVVSADFARTLERELEQAQAELARGEGAFPECPWPETVWTMTMEQYVHAIPSDILRTRISGLLMREGWNLAMKEIAPFIAQLQAQLAECQARPTTAFQYDHQLASWRATRKGFEKAIDSLEKQLAECQAARLSDPTVNNPQEDTFYNKAEASVAGPSSIRE